MTPEDTARFNKAVSLASQGETQSAYTELRALQVSYQADSNLLLWLAFTSPDPAEASRNIEYVQQTDPSNPQLQGAKNWLAARLPAPQPPVMVVQQPMMMPVQPMGVRCQYCGHIGQPLIRQKTSGLGWALCILSALLII